MGKAIRTRMLTVLTSIAIMLLYMASFPKMEDFAIIAYAATNVSNLNATDSSYNFIKAQEGCAYECFWDTAQWSIGYGNKCPYTHTSNGVMLNVTDIH